MSAEQDEWHDECAGVHALRAGKQSVHESPRLGGIPAGKPTYRFLQLVNLELLNNFLLSNFCNSIMFL